MRTLRDWGPLVGWLGGLVVGLVAFHALGDGQLAAPPLDPQDWGAWVGQRTAPVAMAALGRVLVIALAWYLVGVTSVGVAARLLRAARLVRLADAMAVPPLRHALRQALGLGLAGAMVAGASTPLDAPTPAPEVAAVGQGWQSAPVGEGSGSVPADVTVAGASVASADGAATSGTVERLARPGRVTLRPLGDEPATVTATLVQDDATGAADHREGAADVAADAGSHTVVAGESLWSIAQDALAAAWGREPADHEVLGHWRAVIAANESRLADPDNPDLIFPDDEIVLPAPPTDEAGA